MRRRLLFAAGAAALAGCAYAAVRVGRAYDRDDPVAGLATFARTVRAGMTERERDLRDALGLDVGAPAPRGKGDGRAPLSSPRHTATEAPLTPDQARSLLRDPAGPDPRRVDEGSGI
ncbi:MAG: hypothetical protein U0Q21_07485 [Dermatophilaceae bacterium]